MVPQRNVSLISCPIHVHPRAYVYIIYEKTKIKFPGENYNIPACYVNMAPVSMFGTPILQPYMMEKGHNFLFCLRREAYVDW